VRKLRLLVSEEPWGPLVGFSIQQELGGRFLVASEIEMKEVREGSLIQPTFHLEAAEVQSLFNRLWVLGYRPKDGTGNSGHIGSIERHLEDMRALAFGKLNVDKP